MKFCEQNGVEGDFKVKCWAGYNRKERKLRAIQKELIRANNSQNLKLKKIQQTALPNFRAGPYFYKQCEFF